MIGIRRWAARAWGWTLNLFGWAWLQRTDKSWTIVRGRRVGGLFVHRALGLVEGECWQISLINGLSLTSAAFSRRQVALDTAETVWRSLGFYDRQICWMDAESAARNVKSTSWPTVFKEYILASGDVSLVTIERVAK